MHPDNIKMVHHVFCQIPQNCALCYLFLTSFVILLPLKKNIYW